MKKYSVLALVLVLTAALFVGCGCTNRNMDNTSAPTTMPTTVPTTHATTEPVREETTLPIIDGTDNHETIDNGNGPLPDLTGTTEETITEGAGRARQRMPIE